MIGFQEESAERQHVLIVHEPGRRWVDAIGGRWAGFPVKVRHSTTTRDTLAFAQSERCCTVLVELGRRPLETLEMLQQIGGLCGEAAAIVLGRSNQADWEVVAREFGAAAFFCEPITGAEIARDVLAIMSRQLQLTDTIR